MPHLPDGVLMRRSIISCANSAVIRYRIGFQYKNRDDQARPVIFLSEMGKRRSVFQIQHAVCELVPALMRLFSQEGFLTVYFSGS
mgnify:FL=1